MPRRKQMGYKWPPWGTEWICQEFSASLHFLYKTESHALKTPGYLHRSKHLTRLQWVRERSCGIWTETTIASHLFRNKTLNYKTLLRQTHLSVDISQSEHVIIFVSVISCIKLYIIVYYYFILQTIKFFFSRHLLSSLPWYSPPQRPPPQKT